MAGAGPSINTVNTIIKRYIAPANTEAEGRAERFIARLQDRGEVVTALTPDDIAQIAEVIDTAIAARMEQVYGEIEALKEQVREAVVQVRDTAQVLHDNDVAVMSELARTRGEQSAELVARVNESWGRFVKGEAEQLGWRVVVPK